VDWAGYGAYISQDKLVWFGQQGAERARMWVNLWAWRNNIMVNNKIHGNVAYRTLVANAIGWCRQAGVVDNLVIGCFVQYSDNWEGKFQKKADFLMGNHPEISHAQYLQCVREIAALGPTEFNLFNEPPGWGMGLSYSASAMESAYWTLINDAINAVHSVSPNTLVWVESCPFWDQSYWSSHQLMQSNIGYEFHWYDWPGEDTSYDSLLASGTTEQQMNRLRTNVLYGSENAVVILNKGKPVLLGECGVGSTRWSYWQKRMTNVYNLARELAITWVQVGLDGNSAENAASDYFGMLTNCWSPEQTPILNSVGELWRQNL